MNNVNNEVVILLHGLGRSRLSMMLLAYRLKKSGYQVLNFGYFSLRGTIRQHAEKLSKFIARHHQLIDNHPFHLVGHSLGCVVARYYAGHCPSPLLRRIVMLAPPNRPPRLAQFLRNFFLYRWLTGQVGQELADDEFYADNLPVCRYEIGIVAGKLGNGKPHARVFRQAHDFILNIDETRLQEMRDWIVISSSHTFIMNRRQTFELVQRFLQCGHF